MPYVDQHGHAGEQSEIDLVDPVAVSDEMEGRVAVGARVRPDRDATDVKAELVRTVGDDVGERVAWVDRRRSVERQ